MSDTREHDRIEAEIVSESRTSDPFAAAVRATRMPMLITDPTAPDNPIVFANRAFSVLTGYDHDEILSHNCRFLQGPGTNRRDVARIREAVDRLVPIEIDLLNYKKTGEHFWNRLLVSPVFDADGTLTYFFASQYDVTLERERLIQLESDRAKLEAEVARRTGELRRSEERLQFIIGAGRLGLWTLDLSERRLDASPICREIFGRPAADTFSYAEFIAAILPEDRARVADAIQESSDSRGSYDVEYRIRTPDGEQRWLQVRGRTDTGADGQPTGMAGIAIDVTDRKRAEEHRVLLASELDHRVKNSLATVQSIAHQTLTNASSLADARDALDARLRSLAAAHDVLTRESWTGASLREVVEGALRPFRMRGADSFHIEGDLVILPARLAQAFMLALHELATNASKYGALSAPTGVVRLRWEVTKKDPARLRLTWTEEGGPEVREPSRIGFGSRMIERVLAAELGGRAVIRYLPEGVVVTVEAPLPPPDGTAPLPDGAAPLRDGAAAQPPTAGSDVMMRSERPS